ncbi:sigma-70 family RNA polymerase sigma factor [Granulicella arctica]|uniref:RNA polymerase sigma factor (Sigma-70 family) n=1 Tax=Granulicella arctica TaxID=940613 RepID=A0A7Y9TSG9_9BACT|nr:RNA polymerase sigma factor (sigma-70 family) [Granulicella arctica]
MSATDHHRIIEAVWRIESARVIAGLTRLTRDVGLAEDFAQEALVAALEQWPQSGVPENPGAWLTATAKRRAIDLFRRNAVAERKHEDLARDLATLEQTVPDLNSNLDDPIGDDLLRLVFISCHPILPAESRAALTLRLLGGLTTPEIARAFLTPEPTIAQRIVRAKRTLAEKHIPFEVPRGLELAARLSSVLEVIYLIFNEGYFATAGDDLMRPTLCEDALRLGRILAELTPDEPEVHGLVALMEIQASRTRARIGLTGEPILLLEQNRAHWDHLLIRRGLTAIDRAHKIGKPRGPYLLQAEIAACHARARTPEETDWPRIVFLYTELAHLTPSPVIELNRAVAVSMVHGPQAALDLVEALATDPSLDRYHLLPSVRADLLLKLNRPTEARTQFELAAALTQNTRERALLLSRGAACQTK